MVADRTLESLLQRVWNGERIFATDAERLYGLPLEELGALADRRRQLAKADALGGTGNQSVTFIVDRNVNYTNVCNVYCKFCAFWRSEKDTDAYVLTLDELDQKIEETIALGGTQMLMQGGHHPKLSKDWYLKLLAHVRLKYPGFNIHGFSPSEVVAVSEFFQEPVETLLRDFMAAGLGSLPGGGGEILVDRVRARIAPLKANTVQWMGVMDVAHELGLASTATMMFGHVETLADRIEHLEVVRSQQDRSLQRLVAKGLIQGGSDSAEQAREYSAALEAGRLNGGAFTAFICWTFQAENTVLRAETVGGHAYLRTQALARIYLDNVTNLQSSWVTQGPEIGQVALKYGANDFGSIMIEENVVSSAGATFRLGVTDMERLIEELGYRAVQRDNWYRRVEKSTRAQ